MLKDRRKIKCFVKVPTNTKEKFRSVFFMWPKETRWTQMSTPMNSNDLLIVEWLYYPLEQD